LTKSLSQTIKPYAIDAIAGAMLGLAIGACLVVAWHGTRRGSKQNEGQRRDPIPERVRHEVWRRDRAQCVDCASRERLEFDHIIPLSKGGSNTTRNLELRCEPCNRRKGARI